MTLIRQAQNVIAQSPTVSNLSIALAARQQAQAATPDHVRLCCVVCSRIKLVSPQKSEIASAEACQEIVNVLDDEAPVAQAESKSLPIPRPVSVLNQLVDRHGMSIVLETTRRLLARTLNERLFIEVGFWNP